MTAFLPRRFAHRRAPLRVGGRVRAGWLVSPLCKPATQLAYKVTGSPAVLSQAVRGRQGA